MTLMKRVPLSNAEFTKGFAAGLPALNPALENTFAEGSRNQIMAGDGFTVPWQGMAGQGDNSGSRVMRQVLQTWGGLQDYYVGSTLIEGKGSFFSDIGKSLWFIGAGRPNIEGDRIAEGVFASTELQVAIAVNGVYSAATTYDAGLPQPSSPDIGIISTPGFGFTGLIEGPISCKLARLRLTTGARSVASKTSAVVNPQKKTVRVTFPLPSQGQDYWAVFFTQSGFGGVGLHYRAAYQDSLDISEATVAAGVIDGIARSLEFDFKDGDLIPEEAYIDDYPPPAGTHAVRLANVMCVLGAYGDSTAPVTASDPGTVGAISLPNFYESYKPRYLVYFPEQIIDVMARPTDEYAYVGHRNCVTALQYVGVQDGPAVAVSMVWPDIGIAKPHNWCQVHGLLHAFQAKGGPVRMLPDGSPDYSFAAPVRRYMRDWTVDETIVGSHPDSLSVVYFNGREALSWSLQAQKWSPPCFFEDVCVEDSPIPSSSPSSSPSPSASPSSSPSASASPSRSPSASPSASPSSSFSASPSASPSASLSASPSSSFSASPSASPSSSPSASPSSSPSSSASASAPEGPGDLAEIWEYWEAAMEVGLNDTDPMAQFTGQVNARHFSQATEANKPIYRTAQINGLPAVRFSGSPVCFVTGPDMSALTNAHCFLVVKVDDDSPATASVSGLWTMGGDAVSPDTYPGTDTRIRMSVFYHTRLSWLGARPTLDSWRVLEIISQASTTSPNGLIWRIDGSALIAQGNTNPTANGQAAPILGRSLASNFLVGYIAGMYLFSSRLADAGDRGVMVDYINTKFGLSMV